MQKKLIVLAIAGLSGAAFAQSNVTISGQMDIGFDNISATGCSAAGCANLTSRNRVVDNNSNLRFSGTEKLGNGMEAWFQIESAIGTSDNVGTTGAQTTGVATSTGVGTRNTAVGLRGNWGSVLIGKWDIYYSTLAPVDASGLANGLAMGTSSLDILFTNNGANSGGGRFNNVVMYSTPNFNGFSADIAYSTSSANEVTTPAVDKESNVFLNPKYSNGPIAVFYAYLKRSDVGNAAAGTSPDAKFNRAGAAYTLPMGLKFGLIWDTNSTTTAAGVETKRTAWAFPVSYTMGQHAFNFTYAKANNSNVGGADVANTNAKMTMLGYTYSLSKRTSLGLSWTSINNDSAAKYDLWHPSSSATVQSAAGLPAGADPRQVSLNVKHSF